jgi:hypothetical protein
MRFLGLALRAGLALPLVLAASCFPEDEAPPPAVSRERAAATRPLPPEPSTFKVDMKFTFDLPEKTAAELGLPAQFKGTLAVDLRADALDPAGRRSRLTGKVDLSITDLEGKRAFVTNSMTLDGESDGSPSRVLGQGLDRAVAALGLLVKGIPAKQAPADAKPAAGTGTGAAEPSTVRGAGKIDLKL